MEQPGPNMLPNGMAPQNMNAMQRPQPGNIQQQIHASIIDNLRQKQAHLPPGWQSTFGLPTRAAWIMQMVTLLRAINTDLSHCMNVAQGFEERTIVESSNKEVYQQRIKAKLAEITQHRANNAQNILQQGQMGIPMNNNGGNMGMQQNGMGNMNFMQNMGMGGGGGGMNTNMNNGFDLQNMGMNMGMSNGQMGGNGMQQNQNFPAHLQRQMQPSPLPQQNQPQQPPNNTLDPAALRNPQMPAQMQNMNQQQNINLSQVAGLMQPTNEEVATRARAMLATMTEEAKALVRSKVWNSMSEAARQHLSANGQDPVNRWVHNRARDNLIREKNGLQPAGQQNVGGMMMGSSMNMGGNQMQQQPSTQGGSQNIDFNTITGLQANAIKSQESGGEVVPASNNPSNANPGGNVNMPQGVNPQMLGNQSNGQQGNNLNMQQMQLMAIQQQRQRELQAQQPKNRLAQQQPMAQQAQANLRGQPGGLSTPNALNGGQVNSPAMNMSMLNRPMAPPGQGTPATPHQNQQQSMPHTPMNQAGQLAQHHQNMLNQNQNNQPSNNLPAYVNQFIASIPNNESRAKLQGLPLPQIFEAMQGMAAGRGISVQELVASMAGGSANRGPQIGTQQPVNNGLPQNMGNAVPNFTSQPPPSQQPQRPIPDPATIQRMQQQQQQSQIRQRALDWQEYPKALLQKLGIQVPEHVDSWLRLKQHIAQNQGILPPNTIQRVNQAQALWFDSHPEDVQRAMNEFSRQIIAQRQQQQQQQQQQQKQQQQQQQQGQLQGQQQGQQPGQQQGQQGKHQPQQPQQPQGTRPPSSTSMVGQAPQAQMVPPTAPMQQQGQSQAVNMPGANMGQGPQRMPPFPPPTDAEVAQFRIRFPNSTEKSDDDIKKIIHHSKIQKWRQINGMGGGQMGVVAQETGQQTGQQPGPRPPQGQNRQGNAAAQTQGQNRQQAGGDDVVEIKNPATSGPGNVPSATMQQNVPLPMGQPFGLMKMPTQEQVRTMTPEQRQRQKMDIAMQQQREAMRKAGLGLAGGQAGMGNQQRPMQNHASTTQQPQPSQAPTQPPDQNQAMNQPPSGEELFKIQQWYREVERITPRGEPLQMNSLQLAEAQPLLKKLFPLIASMSKTYVHALRHPALGESKVKSAMKVQILLKHNIADASGKVKDFLAIPLQELKRMEQFVSSYVSVLNPNQRTNEARAAAAAGQTGAAQLQQQQQQQQMQGQVQPPAAAQQVRPTQQPAAAAPPLDRKPSASGTPVRKQSSSNKVPAAPTENKTFDWGAPSPHGVPKYDPARNELTPDKLKFPPTKKRKTGQQSESQSSTPAAQSGTPGATGNGMGASPAAVAGKGAPSPEQIRRMQQAGKQQEVTRPKFKCDDMTCEKSITGFETEEQLAKHREAEHQPIEDPLKFLLDTTEAFVKGEESIPAAQRETLSTTRSAKPTPAPSKPTAIKNEKPSSTAATPSATLKTTTGRKPSSATPASITKKEPEQALTTNTPEPSLLDLMAQKIGFDLPAPIPETSQHKVPWTPTLDEWNDLLFSSFTANPATTTGTNASESFANDFSQFSGVTDWGLPQQQTQLTVPAGEEDSDPSTSPHLTPDSRSSRESDISRSAALRINLHQWDPFNSHSGEVEAHEELFGGLGLGAGGEDAEGKEKEGGEEMDWSRDLFGDEDFFGLEQEDGGLKGMGW